MNGKGVTDVSPCDDGEACTSDACSEITRHCDHTPSSDCDQCLAKNCVPKCKGLACGDDGCGGSCGTCKAGELCVTETGACKSFPSCDHELPTCKTSCSSRQFAASAANATTCATRCRTSSSTRRGSRARSCSTTSTYLPVPRTRASRPAGPASTATRSIASGST